MQFRTEIELAPSRFQIRYQDPVLLSGSCFTEYIGRRLSDLLFQAKINPFGVVYNPLSVERSLDLIIEAKNFKAEDLEFYNEKWFSWDHHSSFSGPHREIVVQNINEHLDSATFFLKKASYIFISFGTAWVYRLKKTGNIVCNCHKVPAREFSRNMLTIEEIVLPYRKFIEKLRIFNPGIKIIFTISPVRHWKDGAHGNQLSKSVLHLAVNNITEEYSEFCDYFPSYEILLDDLRDYRFYNNDLLHPNDQAIDYIWEKFSACYFGEKTRKYINEIQAVVRASKHRLMNPGSESSKKFVQNQLEKIHFLEKELTFLNWESLKNSFKKISG